MARKTKEDPTGQARNRQKGARALVRRINRAEIQVKKLFRAIPRERRRKVSIVNQEETVIYDYDIDDQGLSSLEMSVLFILSLELLQTQIGVMPFDWFWKKHIEPVYRQGTAEEISRINRLINGVIVDGLPVPKVPIESVLLSEPYRQALNKAQVSNFSSIKTLSDRTAAQVTQQLNLGIQAGNTPTEIAGVITERFDVSRSSAERIARTEVNKAYNDAKLNAVDVAAEQTKLRAGVIHISALIPTTRSTHAARHGNAYTTADQMKWWNEGANRINCLCNTESVLINRAGKVVQSEFQDNIKSQRVFFDN